MISIFLEMESVPEVDITLPNAILMVSWISFHQGTCHQDKRLTIPFPGGDCIECNSKVWDISKIGDGICQGGNYNSEVCGWDAGDCIDFNTRYPECHVPHPYKVGDDHCDGNVYFVEECGNDGFDCSGCNVEKPAWIGDGE